jgi:hypothetical protein
MNEKPTPGSGPERGPLETIRQALTKDHDGGPATLLGAALDKLNTRLRPERAP